MRARGRKITYFADHPVPYVVDFLAMLPVSHQVKVIGELHSARKLLQDIDAETLAAFLNIHALIG